MKILYFAWMREHTGCSTEEIRLPENVDNDFRVGNIFTWSLGWA